MGDFDQFAGLTGAMQKTLADELFQERLGSVGDLRPAGGAADEFVSFVHLGEVHHEAQTQVLLGFLRQVVR